MISRKWYEVWVVEETAPTAVVYREATLHALTIHAGSEASTISEAGSRRL